MIFGLGQIFKAWRVYQSNSDKVDALRESIQSLEEENAKSLFQALGGVKHFEASLLVVDTAFEIQMNELLEKKCEGVPELQEKYLELINGRFEVIRNDLQGIAASKAEVVALGLALRELSIALKGEAEKIEMRVSDSAEKNRRNADALLRGELNKVLVSTIAQVTGLEEKIEQFAFNAENRRLNLERRIERALFELEREQLELREVLKRRSWQFLLVAVCAGLFVAILAIFLIGSRGLL